MSYSEENTLRGKANSTAPPTRFLVEPLMLGSAIGLALIWLNASIWCFYLAPLLAIPLLLRELRAFDRRSGAS